MQQHETRRRATAPRVALLALLAALALAGCGKPAPKPAPLTAAEWKSLPADRKYSAEVLERLKAGDPKLDTAEGWEEFNRTTLLPERKKDFPRKR